MTVGQSIINWLLTFGSIEVSDSIETDQLDSAAGSKGLYKQPDKTVTEYLDGTREVTERYYFLIRQASKADATRIGNQEWLELLERWIWTQQRSGIYPALDGGRSCFSVGVAVSAYMSGTSDSTAEYQISIKIDYTEV